LLAQLFGETLDLRSEHLAARLRENVGEVAHDDKGNKPTPPRAHSRDPEQSPEIVETN